MLHKIWKLEDRVIRVDLGLGHFQFDFEKEEDIKAVIKMQPFHFDYWMISLVRWQPKNTRNYPSDITFWVRVLGVSLEFWAAPTFQSIGDAIGITEEVDLDYGRVKVTLDGFTELVFETTVDFDGGEFHDGEEALISLRYEKLFGHCHLCFRLCHASDKCPSFMRSPDKKAVARDDKTMRYEDRARSYKGVVIHGETGQEDKEADRKHNLSKGKGKLDTTRDVSWQKVEGKEYRRYNRSYRPVEEGSSRIKSTRKDLHREEETMRFPKSRELQVGHMVTSATVSQGQDKIMEPGEFHQPLLPQVTTLALESEKNLPKESLDEDRATHMETDENHEVISIKPDSLVRASDVVLESTEDDVLVRISDDEFQNLTDGEQDGSKEVHEEFCEVVQGEVDKDQKKKAQDTGELKTADIVGLEGQEDSEVNEMEIGLGDKNPGARRKLFKTMGAAGTTKKRLVQAISGTRKRYPTKTLSSKQEDLKQAEGKGIINPKPDKINP